MNVHSAGNWAAACVNQRDIFLALSGEFNYYCLCCESRRGSRSDWSRDALGVRSRGGGSGRLGMGRGGSGPPPCPCALRSPWGGLGWAGLGWAGLGWAGLGWLGSGSRADAPCAPMSPFQTGSAQIVSDLRGLLQGYPAQVRSAVPGRACMRLQRCSWALRHLLWLMVW
jgi:hypothetical protein